MPLVVSNVRVPPPGGDPRPAVARALGVPLGAVVEARLLRRSLDARRRPPAWMGTWRVRLDPPSLEEDLLARARGGVRRFTARDAARYGPADPDAPPPRRPRWPAGRGGRVVVVGAGPAGLLAAHALAEAGAPVVLLERGAPVEERRRDVRRFWRHGELDPESNVLFGEGGAGAFSDGKIYTRRRDAEVGEVLRLFVRHGADPRILEEGWAHLGTDRIQALLPRLRATLLELGVDLRFHSRVARLRVDGGRCRGVVLADGGEIEAEHVVVACGHSARDTWAAMVEAGAAAERLGTHVGVRVEHPQRMVDRARYGRADRGDLPPASYRLRSRPPGGRSRPAHTFCMCPGGTIVPATAQPERLVVNGMSWSARASPFANSAVVVEVRPEDYPGDDPLAGARFQDAIEAAAYRAGGGDYVAPAQLVEDFLAGRAGEVERRVSYPRGVRSADLRELFPDAVVHGIEAALRHFDRRMPGFAGPEAVLVAPETRTSSPVRFPRGPDRASTTLPGLYPVGEGAGYAGGITSSGLDGLRTARAILLAAVSGS